MGVGDINRLRIGIRSTLFHSEVRMNKLFRPAASVPETNFLGRLLPGANISVPRTVYPPVGDLVIEKKLCDSRTLTNVFYSGDISRNDSNTLQLKRDDQHSYHGGSPLLFR